MTRRTRMILIRAAVVVFLLYAVVNVVNLRTQIKSKRDELASLTLRVEEYQRRTRRSGRKCKAAFPRRISERWRGQNWAMRNRASVFL